MIFFFSWKKHFLSGSVGRIWPIRQKKRKRSVTSFSTQASTNSMFQWNHLNWEAQMKWISYRESFGFFVFSYSDRIFFFRVMPRREFVTIFFWAWLPFKIGRHLFKRRRNITIHVPMTKITTQSRTDEFISPLTLNSPFRGLNSQQNHFLSWKKGEDDENLAVRE